MPTVPGIMRLNTFRGFKRMTNPCKTFQMLRQFHRKICVHWLCVFKERSIDPVSRPQEVVKEALVRRIHGVPCGHRFD